MSMRLTSIGKAAMALLAGIGLTAAMTAKADVILYGSLNTEPGGFETFNSDQDWFAQQFTTAGQAGPVTLTDVRLNIIPIGPATFNVGIYSDLSGPDTQIGSDLAGTVINGALPTIFTASGMSLAANSTFWVVVRAATGVGIVIDTYDPNGSETAGLGYSNAEMFSNDGGGSWSASPLVINATYPAGTIHPLQMRVMIASSVPEPSQWAMMGLTLVGAGGFYIRRRQGAKLPVKS